MKTWRHKKILELIKEQEISTQEDLVVALQNAGFSVTQATVSRDIKELGLIKVPGNTGISRYTVAGEPVNPRNEDRMKRLFRDSVVSLDYSENLIIIKTPPGEAQGVASTIDNAGWPEIIGTVAGDDTILIIIKPKKMTHATMKKFIALTGR
ncbi:arginine repressor [Desulfoscipio gibsoniae]|uniref:Arginine repressor n=1 Tax=Desulfoscipio gibsoniae DSM 7213 TaxID=767817 RepID=R4KFR1_9FIRM|nr:arginine repressor [Desulfoscipio gibsoniae]AGL02003.1 arginine repressor [Desulfoscipio gibsoniae DSM 7213]